MDKQSAAKIIRDTFQNPFDKGRFVHFAKNLLNRIDETKAFYIQGHYVFESFRDHVKSYERIGTYTDPEDNKIDILIVYLQKETALESARTRQRNFVARYLKDRGEKEVGLVAFVPPDTSDWRFSLVKMEYHLEGGAKIRTQLTPARRWSFLVGKNESSHTAQSQLIPILQDDSRDPTMKQLEAAFNIESVTKEFFEKYRELLHDVTEELNKKINENDRAREGFDTKGVDTVNFAKKLLGQIVFLYFLQKKGWLGVPQDGRWGDGDRRFLRSLFQRAVDKGDNFFDRYLEYLFYDALAREERGAVDPSYYSPFNCKIPFLNGGLFDPINNYDWGHTEILLSNELFSNTVRTKEGDAGTGILDIFDRYNFTVKEDEPLEKDVAVDPEMLGKVFENLLEVKDRKSRGTYYTPREIVHYMCQESLINYLDTTINTGEVPFVTTPPPQGKLLGKPDPEQVALKAPGYRVIVPREDIETLVRMGELVVEHDARVESAGRETRDYSYKLPRAVRWNAQLIDDKLADIRICDPAVGSGAFLVGMMTEVVRVRSTLKIYLPDREVRTKYNFKWHAIQNCLYGVDIDPGAVEIAKLRLWLSLVVDEEDIREIQPLPNLDYKIVCGNSLLGYPYMPSWTKEIEELKQKLFGETNIKMKQQLKNQIDSKLKGFLANSQKSLGYMVDFDFRIFFSEVFDEKDGFDVVIANPPYVEHKKLKKVSSSLKDDYKTYSGTADIYVYFYEKGLGLLRENGFLAFISSNKFFKTSYGMKLRALLSANKLSHIVDFTKVRVFDALVATCVILISKQKPQNYVLVTSVGDDFLQFRSLNEYARIHSTNMEPKNLDASIWQFEDSRELAIKTKIESGCQKLHEVDGTCIFRGVTTGCNDVFIVDGTVRSSLIKSDLRSKEVIKPLLQGRNIRKWFYEESNEFLIFTRTGIAIDSYPVIKKYLSRFRDKLEPGKGRKPGQYNWYEIQDNTAYHQEFEKEKIIWGLTADKWAFAYDDTGHYLPSNGYILTSSQVPIKSLLAILNSRLMEYYFKFIGIMTAGGAFTLKHETIAEFPIKDVPDIKQDFLVNLVDEILSITKDEDYLSNPTKKAKVKELERQIDQSVYQLYDLTPEEIQIIEGSIGV